MPQAIIESRAVVLEGTGLNRVMRVITPGMGSSGFYSSAVLESAVKDGVFDTGLHCYVDHPTATEATQRPERSVRDLAAVSTGPAVWNAEAQSVDQPIKIFPHYGWLGDKDLAEAIGMSIRASAEISQGDIEGRSVRIVDKLVEADSVDFVTRAGRGGRVLEAMESARPSDIAETLQSDFRQQLGRAVAEKYATDTTSAWVRDYDPTEMYVVISIYPQSGDERRLLKEGYSVAASGVSLSGNPTEVRVMTSYVAVNQPATEAKSTMEITEAEHQALVNRAEEAERERDRLRAADRARQLGESAADRFTAHVGTSLDGLPDVVSQRALQAALAEGIPTTDSGALSESAWDAVVDRAVAAERAYVEQISGRQVVEGHGETVAPEEATKASEAAIKRIRFNRPATLKG